MYIVDMFHTKISDLILNAHYDFIKLCFILSLLLKKNTKKNFIAHRTFAIFSDLLTAFLSTSRRYSLKNEIIFFI